MENFLGYLASVLTGVSLGLIGGGDSIVTIPVLVYLFHIEPTLATAYSFFIVGVTSAVGGVRSALLGIVDLRSAVVFSIPSSLAVYLTRHFLLPCIPERILSVSSFVLTSDVALMLFFSGVMILAAVRMILNRHQDEPHHND